MADAKEIARRRLDVWHQAGARWAAAAPERIRRLKSLRAGGPLAAADPERLRTFLARELRRVDASNLGIERIIRFGSGSRPDWSPRPPTEAARKAGRPVARIIDAWASPRARGFGTGFLITPRLLITNHHVFATASEAAGGAANFLHEEEGPTPDGVVFELRPQDFFFADEALDFAVVAVSDRSRDGSTTLGSLGTAPLIGVAGKVIEGQPIHIIQHPDGGPKMYATEANQLLHVLPTGHLHYTTDTEPGSSGSPAFNAHWEVVGLHHSGVPRMENGSIVTRSGKPWTPDVPDDEIDWIANEAVRASKIVERLNAHAFSEAERGFLPELVASWIDPVGAGSSDGHGTTIAMGGSVMDGRPIVMNFYGSTTIHFGAQAGAAAAPPPPPPPSPPPPTAGALAVEKPLRFDPHYARRKGYREAFLGAKFKVEFPTVSKARQAEIWVSDEGDPHLHYHHFTLVMNRDRRLQMWSAVNVSYSPEHRAGLDRDDFGKDRWIPDPRLPLELQITDPEFYKPATKVDRGHIVRRNDNAWGKTPLEMEYANSDTFHWTNCTPQHEAFNRANQYGLWGRFEDYIQENIGAVGDRVSIFAGPVLAANDPERDYGFGPVKYPVSFWKVVASITLDDAGKEKLVASGFMFKQSSVIAKYGLERIDFSEFDRYRCTLKDITKRTGVEFPKALLDADEWRARPEERGGEGTLPEGRPTPAPR